MYFGEEKGRAETGRLIIKAMAFTPNGSRHFEEEEQRGSALRSGGLSQLRRPAAALCTPWSLHVFFPLLPFERTIWGRHIHTFREWMWVYAEAHFKYTSTVFGVCLITNTLTL